MKVKLRKKSKWIVISLSVIFVIYILSKIFTYENRIESLVTKNISFLNQCIEYKVYDKIYKIKAVKQITPYASNNELVIDFYCYGFGIVPSSIYYGFYYTSKDEPKGFQNVDVKFIPYKNGWKWEEERGDNWQYTRKIADHWYYYEAGF